jgi:hypothetical protein
MIHASMINTIMVGKDQGPSRATSTGLLPGCVVAGKKSYALKYWEVKENKLCRDDTFSPY